MAELLPEEQITLSAYDALASEWADEVNLPGFWQQEMGRFHELLPSGSVIEVGAGGARDAKELVRLGYDYVGSDVSPGLLEVARRELPGYTFIEQSVYDLDFNGAQFDGFWTAAVLQHIPKQRIDEALHGIRAVVRARAIGFISIMDGDGARIEQGEVGGNRFERYFVFWSKDEFAGHLEAEGLKVIDYTYRPMTETVQRRWHGFFVEAE